MRRVAVALLVLVAALGFWMWSRNRINHWPIRNDPPRGDAIIAFGDSLTEGTGVEPEQAWPALLSSRIGRPVINAGRAAESSGDAMRRLDSDVLGRSPRIVILCLGGNDLLRRQSTDQMFANLRAMVDRIQGEGAFVILVGVNGSGLLSAGGDVDEGFRDLARDTGCVYVPNILKGIMGKADLTLQDRIHPNADGHRRIAQRIEAVAGERLLR